MTRPKKEPEDKRDNRLTFYMNELEQERLTVWQHLDLDKTKMVSKSLAQFMTNLEKPPNGLKQARHEKIMQPDNEPKSRLYLCAWPHCLARMGPAFPSSILPDMWRTAN